MTEQNTDNEENGIATINGIQVSAKKEDIVKLRELTNNITKTIEENKRLKNEVLPFAKAEFERTQAEQKLLPKEAPKGGDTSRLTTEQATGHTFKIDPIDSQIELSWLKADTPEQLINIVNKRAKAGDKESQAVLNKLTRKVAKQTFDWSYDGSPKQMLKHDLIINEFDSAELKAQKQLHNERLMANRVAWHTTQDGDE